MCFLSRVFIIPCVISATPVTNATKNINAGKFGESLYPMSGYGSVSERDTVLEFLNLLGLALIRLDEFLDELLVLVIVSVQILTNPSEFSNAPLELAVLSEYKECCNRLSNDNNEEGQNGVRHGAFLSE